MEDETENNQTLRSSLAETKQKLDALVNCSLDAIISMSQDGRVLLWNPSAEVIFGWSAPEAIGQEFSELIFPPEHRDAHNAEIALFLETRQSTVLNKRIERVALRRDGSQIHVELNVLAVELPDRFEFTAVIRDISERKAARDSIEDRESQLAAILHSTAEGIYGLDMKGNCTFANNACAKLLGYESSDQLLGRNMHTLIHHTKPDGTAYPNHECHIYKAFRLGNGVHIDDEVLWRKDGSSFPAEYWSYPIKIGGELVGSVLTFLDISQRRELELAQEQVRTTLEVLVDRKSEDLAATQKRLELALQAGNIGLWDWNAETNDVFFSDTYKRQLGYPIDEPWDNFDDWGARLHPDDQDAALKRVGDYFAARSGEYESTFRLQCQDGTYRWFLAQGKASFSEDGNPLRMLGVHVDITQRMQNERELERLNEALEQSNLELQQFAYVASHDLQTPLRAIAGFAQFLQADYGDRIDETATNYIQRIVKGAVRMQKMIDDLLAFSRVESQGTPFTPVDMNAVFADAVELLSSCIDERNATVTCDSLPSVVGDESQLVQLLQNLIGNSLKYCEKSPVVHVSADQSKDSTTFSVADNGIGIAENHFDKIFEVFQRLHGRDAYPGTGIGLAVCRRIVNRHGGTIQLESVEHVGTTFKFELPHQARG